jgi:hypothetical protein
MTASCDDGWVQPSRGHLEHPGASMEIGGALLGGYPMSLAWLSDLASRKGRSRGGTPATTRTFQARRDLAGLGSTKEIMAMGIGTSIFLIAVGAILDFAVKVNTNGFNINTIGLILMIVGAIGLLLSVIFWGTWGGFGGYRRNGRVGTGSRTYIEDRSY